MTTATTVNVQFQLRADTAANWTAANPILLTNEFALETDTKKLKVGDGTTAWASLAYFPSIVTGGTVLGNLEIGSTGTLTFEGSTANDFETTLAVTDPTADRTITLPDQSGTVVVSGNASIVDADIAAGAEIAVSKLANGTANQVLVTDGTDVSWSDDLTIAGNLTVNGTTTTVNTETLTVKDKNIELAVVDTPTDVTADGGGITLKGATDKTINWIDATDSWTSSENIDLANGKSYRINDTEVLSATTLGSGVTSSSLTSVGTLGSVTVTGDATAGTFIPTGGTAPSNGLYLPTANSVALSTNGTPRVQFGTSEVVFNDDGNGYDFRIEGDTVSNLFFVDASADAVGIGTTAVDTLLHLESSSSFIAISNSADTGEAGILFRRTDNNQNRGYVSYDFTSDALKFRASDNGAGEDVRIDSSGRLLVGTSSSVNIGAAIGSLIQIEHNSTQNAGFSVACQTNTGGGGVITLANKHSGTACSAGDDLGRLGFAGHDGTDVTNRGAQIFAEADADWTNDNTPGRLVFSVTADGGSSPTTSPSAMTINSGQEVLIGYGTDNGAYKLQVNSQIFATSATIATSDGRYKENVATLDGCVDLVKALRPVSFDWKVQEPVTRVDEDGETVVVREAHNFPDGKQVGFIAQEVEEVLADKPWLGSVIKQNVRPAVTDADGNELAPEEEFLGIAEGNLVAVLTSALKDAIGRIETLEAEVAALKAS